MRLSSLISKMEVRNLKKDNASNFYKNMMSGKCFTKGINDSTTKQKVLATKKENYFSPDDCYFAYVCELPYGTCYVDAE